MGPHAVPAGRNEGPYREVQLAARRRVTKDGEKGQVYPADRDVEGGRAFVDRGRWDRHQFRSCRPRMASCSPIFKPVRLGVSAGSQCRRSERRKG